MIRRIYTQEELGLLANIFAREKIKKQVESLISTIEDTIKIARAHIEKTYEPVRSQSEKILSSIIKRFEYIKQVHFQNKYATVGTDSPEDILARCHQLVKDLDDLMRTIRTGIYRKEPEKVVLAKLKAKEEAIKKVEAARRVGFFEIANLLKWLVIGIGIIYLAPMITKLIPARRD